MGPGVPASSACVKGICILKMELIPFLWSALVGSCPRSILPVLSSTLPIDGDFRTKRVAGQGWEHQPGAQETWLQPSALTQPPKVTLDESRRLHLHRRRNRLTHANTNPSTKLVFSPALAPASPGQESCWGTRLETSRCIKTLPALPTSFLKFELHLLSIAGDVF